MLVEVLGQDLDDVNVGGIQRAKRDVGHDGDKHVLLLGEVTRIELEALAAAEGNRDGEEVGHEPFP